jgi:hypothetical protein
MLWAGFEPPQYLSALTVKAFASDRAVTGTAITALKAQYLVAQHRMATPQIEYVTFMIKASLYITKNISLSVIYC